MKKLLVYLNDYKKETILGPLFKLTEASFELFVPLVMASIIDKGIATQDRPYIVRMGLVLLALAAIGLTCAITAQYFAAKASVGFATKLRSALFKHIQSLSFTELDNNGTSSFITRMTSDINQVQNGVNLFIRLLLRSPFIVVGAMVMAFTVDAKAALIFVVAIPLMAIVVFGVMAVSIPLYRKVQAMLDKVLGITRENLTGIRVIRAFNKENDEIARFDEENERLTDLQKFVGRISAVMNPVTYIIVNAATMAILWTGAVRVDAGIITQGAVIALVNYMSQILVELVKLANLIITVNKALACADRIESVFEIRPGMEGSPAAVSENPESDGTEALGKKAAGGTETLGKKTAGGTEALGKKTAGGTEALGKKAAENSDDKVVFDHVSMMYHGAGAVSLSDISFTAKKGETIGIIGGTGAGKTTLVSLMPRFYDISDGQLLIDGISVRDYDIDTLRSKIGIVMQKAVLFKGTVRDNIKWGNPDADDDAIYEALRLAQAKEIVDKKGEGLDLRIEQGGRNLSGGQRQRLTIARALVRKPEILILDDSSSALDYATDAALRRALKEIGRDTTIFIVSQRTSSIAHADRIVVLDDGECVGLGTHEELLEGCSVYQEIHRIEVKA
ncbi:MAG: ABC transporter ATP-binding protein [Lachnospiraceae bacterium]|nr:ABC transporter ATP-binding protein [Lachnospiraceae bacterium]